MLARLCMLLIFVSVTQASFGDLFGKKPDGTLENDVMKALRFVKDKVSTKLEAAQDNRHHHHHHHHHHGPVSLTHFSWQNCGSSGDLGVLKSLQVAPDPIHIPGNVTVSFSGQLKQTLPAPVEVSLEIKKKELFWIPVPCIDQMGSCDYSDFCGIIQQVQCPPALKKYKIPCHCPFNKGSFSLPATSLSVDSTFGFPSWLVKGDFQVKAIMRYSGKQVTCINLAFTLG